MLHLGVSIRRHQNTSGYRTDLFLKLLLELLLEFALFGSFFFFGVVLCHPEIEIFFGRLFGGVEVAG